MKTISVDNYEISISRHALIRYLERVRPSLSGIKAAQDEIERLSGFCYVSEESPEWVRKESSYTRETLVDRFSLWLLIGDDVALPLEEKSNGRFEAVTCVVSGGISDAAREARSQHRRYRSQIRQLQRTENNGNDTKFYRKRKRKLEDDYEYDC